MKWHEESDYARIARYVLLIFIMVLAGLFFAIWETLVWILGE
jgi:hypothetical protein